MISPSDNNVLVTDLERSGQNFKCKVVSVGENVSDCKAGDTVYIAKGKSVEVFYEGNYYHSVSKSFLLGELQ